MASDPKLVAVLEARLDKFEKSLKEAGVKVEEAVSDMEDKFEKRIGGAGSSAGSSFGAGFLKGFIGSAAVTGILATIQQAIDKLAELGDRSSDYRLPVEELQALGLGARVSSVSVDELRRALETFTTVSKTSGPAADRFYDALAKINPALNAAFENAPTQSARLRLIMDALASTEDESRRASLAFAAFGSDADRVIQFFARGSSAIDEFRRRAHDLGITITDSMVKSASDAQNQLTTLYQIIQNKLLIAIGELIPALRSMIPTIENIGRVIRDAFESFVDIDLRSTSGLQDLLKTNEQLAAAMEKRIEDLKKSLAEKPVTGVTRALGLDGLDVRNQELKELTASLEKYRAVIYKIQAIIENRANTPPEVTPGVPDPTNAGNAFKRRDDTRTQRSDGFERSLEQMQKRIALREAEAKGIGQTALEQDRLRAVTELQNAAVAAGIPLNKTNNQKIAEMAQRYAEAADRVRLAKDQWAAANQLAAEFGNSAINGIDALVSKSKTLNQVLADTLRTFARMAAQAALLGQGPLAQFFGTASSTPGGVGGLFAPVAKGLAGLFGGFRAEGGSVDANRAYMVGEKGRPEIFVPGTSGKVVPVKNTQSAGGGVTVVMSNDFRDATANALPGILARINRLERGFPQMVAPALREARRTNPWVV